MQWVGICYAQHAAVAGTWAASPSCRKARLSEARNCSPEQNQETYPPLGIRKSSNMRIQNGLPSLDKAWRNREMLRAFCQISRSGPVAVAASAFQPIIAYNCQPFLRSSLYHIHKFPIVSQWFSSLHRPSCVKKHPIALTKAYHGRPFLGWLQILGPLGRWC